MIDLKKEFDDWRPMTKDSHLALLKFIASRVERETIERVMAIRIKDLFGKGGSAFISRLYSSPSDAEKVRQ